MTKQEILKSVEEKKPKFRSLNHILLGLNDWEKLAEDLKYS